MFAKKTRIYVAGHTGMVGSSILRALKKKGYKNLIYTNSKNLDLRDQSKTLKFLKKTKPQVVFIASAKVGGIMSNATYGADFISDNLQIQNNLIISSFKCNVEKLIFLSSSCVYPKNIRKPLKEKNLFNGPLEETNSPYAVAKLAGMKLCESFNNQYGTNFITLVPCNLYGENDSFDLFNSHFFPALLKKIDNFKDKKTNEIEIWGDGLAKRELMYVDDLADACVFFMNKKKVDQNYINIGTGKQISIIDYAKRICKILEVKPKFKFDKSKPNGMKTKVLDISISKKLGWKSKISLNTGIKKTYAYYKMIEK
jgi:GDP-L-fucose synthase